MNSRYARERRRKSLLPPSNGCRGRTPRPRDTGYSITEGTDGRNRPTSPSVPGRSPQMPSVRHWHRRGACGLRRVCWWRHLERP
ncbi:hypothetical protein FTUN_2537 [Frigoriglobus tundricola]|uniref:Uncharacterized protein n=1 Tax=Frigoriglobus tundricola TaxID=2774151 RepID=A0A6M5YP57_9BACT|nr:hypothetical protein FTUN_2537 [Frigoriglobus tundricola]